MRDFPVFTTDFGVSTLILKEIPYKRIAYIYIQDVQPDGFDDHLRECVSFCRMAGAEKVLCADHKRLETFPLHVTILQMRGTAWREEEKMRCLFPVTEATVGRWREVYNRRMASVDNTATMERRDEQKIVESGGAYFVHDGETLLGIGWLADTDLLAVASAQPGAGETVMHTLMSLVEGAQMTLEVASTNERAIRLYEKLGFVTTAEVRRWYDVTDMQ